MDVGGGGDALLRLVYIDVCGYFGLDGLVAALHVRLPFECVSHYRNIINTQHFLLPNNQQNTKA